MLSRRLRVNGKAVRWADPTLRDAAGGKAARGDQDGRASRAGGAVADDRRIGPQCGPYTRQIRHAVRDKCCQIVA